MANSFHMEPEEKQFLEYMFKKCYDQWIQENPQAKEYEIGYAQNKIIHELVWRIKPIGAEMSDFINLEIVKYLFLAMKNKYRITAWFKKTLLYIYIYINI